MKKRIIIDSLITIICIGFMIGIFAFIKNKNDSKNFDENNITGNITFIVYYEDNQIVINDSLGFSDGETIYNILERNYNMEYIDSVGVGKGITGINEYKSSWTKDFFKLYVDGKYSNYGVEKIMAKDGMEIKLIWEKLN